MHRSEIREKVRIKLRAMGWRPVQRGGNGLGPTMHEQLLAAAVGMACNIVVPTLKSRGSGYPSCYKIDLGNAILKLGIE